MKYIISLLLLGLLGALLFPRLARKLLRAAGRTAGDFGRAGRELATGEEVRNSPLARYEVRAGQIVEAKMLASHPPSRDDALQTRVADIGARLARHARRREIPYRFTAVESEQPNAFAVPGGAIFITRSLVELCAGDPDRIAGVLAHEIVHIDRRHALRTLATTTAVRVGFGLLSPARAVILSQMSRGMEEMLLNGYRQDQEVEADTCGVRLARLAGFDPRGLLGLLEVLESRRPDAKGSLADFLAYFQSHPPFSARRDHILRELSRTRQSGRGGNSADSTS